MDFARYRGFALVAICAAMIQPGILCAEPIPVHHVEGVTYGFLVLRSLDGKDLAYGELKQVVKEKGDKEKDEEAGLVVDDLLFHFRDGSFYEEIAKFTQRGKFRLVTDQVELKGPSFKQASKSWIDTRTGMVTVRTIEKGKEKMTSKHLALPDDVANGLLFILLKNVDPSAAETTVSFVVTATRPRVVKWNIAPAPEKTIKIGWTTAKAQQYVIKTKIEGAAGVIAPLIGKQPPDLHIWLVKSEAPTFVEYEGPLTMDSPIWRIEMTAPEPASPGAKTE